MLGSLNKLNLANKGSVVDITSKELEHAKVTKKTIKLDKDAIKSLDVSHLPEQSLNANEDLLLVRVSIDCMLGYPHNLIFYYLRCWYKDRWIFSCIIL